jgi:molecular chaperone GrpE (heat shock protein)
VLRVLQAGYMIGDRVVRHSRVVVSGPAPKN